MNNELPPKIEMKTLKRYRTYGIFIFCLIALIVTYLTDISPDKGLFRLGVSGITVIGIFATLLHLLRKSFFDYPEADLQSLFLVAKTSPVGAGLALVAVSLTMIAISMIIVVVAFKGIL